LLTDVLFRRLAVEAVAARPAGSWLARIAWPSQGFDDASHCSDLPFFFDVLADPTARRLLGTAPPQHIADELHGAAVRLLRGQPPEWDEWTPTRGATRVFDPTTVTELDGYRDVRVLSSRL
jgi:para-nitrobenzyl esterase